MKTILSVLIALTSLTTFATTYECEITLVTKTDASSNMGTELLAKSNKVLVEDKGIAKMALLKSNKIAFSSAYVISVNMIENTDKLIFSAVPVDGPQQSMSLNSINYVTNSALRVGSSSTRTDSNLINWLDCSLVKVF